MPINSIGAYCATKPQNNNFHNSMVQQHSAAQRTTTAHKLIAHFSEINWSSSEQAIATVPNGAKGVWRKKGVSDFWMKSIHAASQARASKIAYFVVVTLITTGLKPACLFGTKARSSKNADHFVGNVLTYIWKCFYLCIGTYIIKLKMSASRTWYFDNRKFYLLRTKKFKQ